MGLSPVAPTSQTYEMNLAGVNRRAFITRGTWLDHLMSPEYGARTREYCGWGTCLARSLSRVQPQASHIVPQACQKLFLGRAKNIALCVCVGTELEKNFSSFDSLVCKIEMGISSASLSWASPTLQPSPGQNRKHTSRGWNSQCGQQRALACRGDCPSLGQDE